MSTLEATLPAAPADSGSMKVHPIFDQFAATLQKVTTSFDRQMARLAEQAAQEVAAAEKRLGHEMPDDATLARTLGVKMGTLPEDERDWEDQPEAEQEEEEPEDYQDGPLDEEDEEEPAPAPTEEEVLASILRGLAQAANGLPDPSRLPQPVKPSPRPRMKPEAASGETSTPFGPVQLFSSTPKDSQ